jgi:hypothetical protein
MACDMLNQGQNEKITTRGAMKKRGGSVWKEFEKAKDREWLI